MAGRGTRQAVVVALALVLLAAGIAQARGGYYLSYHAPQGKPAKGLVLVIHGGGWKGGYGEQADTVMAHYIDQFQSWGYRTYNLAFRDGRALADTYAAVERLAKRYPKRPLCAFGGSSGGHLALMAAIKRRELVDCVIDVGGPIDFVRPEDRPRWAAMRERAAQLFGADRLRKVSPVFHTRKIDAAVLVASAECDYYTSIERNRELVDGVRHGKLVVLEPAAPGEPGANLGDHCPVTFKSIARMESAERRFLARYAD